MDVNRVNYSALAAQK